MAIIGNIPYFQTHPHDSDMWHVVSGENLDGFAHDICPGGIWSDQPGRLQANEWDDPQHLGDHRNRTRAQCESDLHFFGGAKLVQRKGDVYIYINIIWKIKIAMANAPDLLIILNHPQKNPPKNSRWAIQGDCKILQDIFKVPPSKWVCLKMLG